MPESGDGADAPAREDGVWSVIANVPREVPYGPGGAETRSGLRKFKAGAKLHVVGGYPGAMCTVIAIGEHRHDGRYIRCAIRPETLENPRVRMIYSPSILALLRDVPNGAAYFLTRGRAEEFMTRLPLWGERRRRAAPRDGG